MSLQYDERALCLAQGLLRGVLDDQRKRPAGFPPPLIWAVAMQHAVNALIAELLLREALDGLDALPWIVEGEPTDANRDCRVTLRFVARHS
jgi:hypothetical protein